MHKLVHLPISQLNEHITCRLCNGYLIDATTIVECLHAFCRSCLLTHLSRNNYSCPVCDSQLHKADPYRAIRLDRALQSLVYKIVPGLFKAEMTRRRQFYVENPSAGGDRSLSPEKRGDLAFENACLVQDDERVSLSLELADTKRIRSGRLLRTDCVDQARACYLLAPACLTVQHLQKFLTLKFNLRPSQSVAIFYTDDCLHADFSIMDIAYVYAWRRKGPLRLFYTVVDSAAKALASVPNTDNPAAVAYEMSSSTASESGDANST